VERSAQVHVLLTFFCNYCLGLRLTPLACKAWYSISKGQEESKQHTGLNCTAFLSGGTVELSSISSQELKVPTGQGKH